MNEHVTKVLLGVVVTLFTAGAMWWASAVHSRLQSIDETLLKRAEFQGTVTHFMATTERRLQKLEDAP